VPLLALPDLCGPYREHERTVCEQLDADIEGSGNSWERVVKMVDLQQVHRALGRALPPPPPPPESKVPALSNRSDP
jgi:hypothetical protein